VAAVHCGVPAEPEPGHPRRHRHVEGQPGPGVCRSAAVPDLLLRDQCSQRSAAPAVLQAVCCELPPSMPVQMVQDQRQEHMPSLPGPLVIFMTGGGWRDGEMSS
jgi:hypothetical protein